MLKEGGEMYFSDVYADRRVGDALRKDAVLWGECLSGYAYARACGCLCVFCVSVYVCFYDYHIDVAIKPLAP